MIIKLLKNKTKEKLLKAAWEKSISSRWFLTSNLEQQRPEYRGATHLRCGRKKNFIFSETILQEKRWNKDIFRFKKKTLGRFRIRSPILQEIQRTCFRLEEMILDGNLDIQEGMKSTGNGKYLGNYTNLSFLQPLRMYMVYSKKYNITMWDL